MKRQATVRAIAHVDPWTIGSNKRRQPSYNKLSPHVCTEFANYDAYIRRWCCTACDKVLSDFTPSQQQLAAPPKKITNRGVPDKYTNSRIKKMTAVERSPRIHPVPTATTVRLADFTKDAVIHVGSSTFTMPSCQLTTVIQQITGLQLQECEFRKPNAFLVNTAPPKIIRLPRGKSESTVEQNILLQHHILFVLDINKINFTLSPSVLKRFEVSRPRVSSHLPWKAYFTLPAYTFMASVTPTVKPVVEQPSDKKDTSISTKDVGPKSIPRYSQIKVEYHPYWTPSTIIVNQPSHCNTGWVECRIFILLSSGFAPDEPSTLIVVANSTKWHCCTVICNHSGCSHGLQAPPGENLHHSHSP